jgi:hypothetical protein
LLSPDALYDHRQPGAIDAGWRPLLMFYLDISLIVAALSLTA